MNANFTAIKNAIDPLEVSNYSIFSSLNYSSTNVGSTLTKLTTTSTTHSFTKTRTDTKIEVHINSRFGSGTFSGNSGVYYEVRIDDTIAPTYGNKGAISTTSTTDFLSIYAVFSGLSAGSHTVSIWAAAPSGTSTGVLVDPGGWGGAIIVKEVH
ncbi:MAG: hypothetical protein HW415_1046 [Deltaproteobacteria bacterium]|nr:hypothetical protein [Deltaproteobacteria bacterium]